MRPDLNESSLSQSRKFGGNAFQSKIVRGKKLNLYTFLCGVMTRNLEGWYTGVFVTHLNECNLVWERQYPGFKF